MLTTLDTVKARLGLDTSDVADDVLLTNFVTYASARFENDSNRSFGYKQNVQDEFEGNESELRVRLYPIDQVQPITFALLTNQSEGWQPVDKVGYVIRKNTIISLISGLGTWKQNLRVTYSGGFILPDGSAAIPGGSSPPALPQDISLACVEQIVYWYQNKDRVGITAIHTQQGGFSQFPKLDLLPSVSAIIAKYERWMS